MRLVLVEWEDSLGCSPSWAPLDSCSPSILVCRSVGWLAYDGDDCKTVIPHLTGQLDGVDPQGCGDMTIPARAVRRIVDLMENGLPTG